MNGTSFTGLMNGDITGVSGGFLAALLAGLQRVSGTILGKDNGEDAKGDGWYPSDADLSAWWHSSDWHFNVCD